MKLDKEFYTIEGRAGTGKSIVGFELARRLTEKSYKVAYFFMGKNTEIYSEFEDFDFNVFSLEPYYSEKRGIIKNRFEKIYTEEFDVLIIDESQRLTKKQINRIKKLIQDDKENSHCIFLLDEEQNMDSLEKGKQIAREIIELSDTRMKLKVPLRFDSNMECFISLLFKKNRRNGDSRKANVDIIKFPNYSAEIEYVNYLTKKQNFTPLLPLHKVITSSRKIYKGKNGFEIIGQEFENVVVILDYQFSFSKDNGLELNDFSPYDRKYDIIQLYYEIITRVKNNLKIIVVNNDELYNNLVHLKNHNTMVN